MVGISLRRTGLSIVAVAFVLMAGLGVGRLNAQTTRAGINGTVIDSSGASVPGASIVVTNVGTSVGQSVTSDAQGRFVVPELPVGNYDVKASKQGFQTVDHPNITLTVGSEVVVDFTMPVGQAQQTVTVESQVSQVDTTSSAVSSTVEQSQMSDLPLNGRNLTDLINLAPGVLSGNSLGGGGSTSSIIYGKQQSFSVSGSRPEGQAYLLDNQNVQDFYAHGSGSAALGTTLGVEAIGEFQILTDTYSAQFGGNGAVVNAVSKSGTNRFHGSTYEYLRNSDLDARNFFDGLHVPEFRQNQFGASVGGPIKKDKLFFFTNYEGFFQALGQTMVAVVPDASVHQGIVNGVNVGVSPLTAPILALYPLPTTELGNGIGQVSEVATLLGHENYLLARADYVMSSKDSISMRWVLDWANLTQPFAGSPLPPTYPEIATQRNQFATVEWRRIISPTVINLARATFSYTPERDKMENPIPSNSPLLFFPERGQIGIVNIGGGITAVGPSIFPPVLQEQVKFNEGDDVVWTKGSHTVKFGGFIERIRTNQAPYGWYGGDYTFASLTTFLQATPSSFTGPVPGQTDPYRDFREIDFGIYANDDWKIRSNLTLNLGLRYDPTTDPDTDKHQLTALITPPFGTGFVPVSNVWHTNPSLRNWDPRLGIAWDPFKDHKTSFRGGFGIFHDVIAGRVYTSGYYYNPPYQLASGLPFPAFPNPFASGIPAAAISQATGVDYNGVTTPYDIQWNFNVQRQIMDSTVLTVAYSGSKGLHLFVERDLNPVLPQTINGEQVYGVIKGPTTVGIQADPRTNPAFGALTSAGSLGFSNYNALQVGLNRRMSHNLQTQLSYTWSRCLDVGSGNYGLEGGAAPPDPYAVDREYGPVSVQPQECAEAQWLVHASVQGKYAGPRMAGGRDFDGTERTAI